MTEFERVRIIGHRSEQLLQGAQPLVKLQDPKDILLHTNLAKREMREGKLHYIVKRKLVVSDNPAVEVVEAWSSRDLVTITSMYDEMAHRPRKCECGMASECASARDTTPQPPTQSALQTQFAKTAATRSP